MAHQSSASWISPPPLDTGARVALVAPAGPLRDESELDRAVANARSLGWEPIVGTHALARHGYLAGPDERRLADLNAALRDRSVDGIWCVRGGYGVMRLLDGIDYDAIRQAPRPIIGFSDITALHAAIGRRAGVVTYHGPTARAPLSPFSRDSLVAAVGGTGADPAGAAAGAETIIPGRAAGRLAGGNLALLASLAGTPYMPDLDGAILVLEDVNEAVYRIDRMLRQLRLAGSLTRLAGIIFGAFTERGDDADALPLADILRETAESAGVPCLAGVPVGHIDDQWTLPLGATAELDATARRLTVHAGHTA